MLLQIRKRLDTLKSAGTCARLLLGMAFTAAVAAAASAPVLAQGLYNEQTYQPLMTDHRAYASGSILTVLIYENATASTSANTRAGRESGFAGSATDGFTHFNGNLTMKNDFEGQGSYNRSGKLMASVSVTVDQVLDNGDLLVEGEQLIKLNNEDQRIRVKGKVRPIDINTDNTVLSTRLAGAEIEFKGQGMLSNRQKPGLITRFFHWLF